MPSDDRFSEYQDNVVHAEQRFGGREPPGPPLPPSGGGGGMFEARVARLESDVGHIKDSVADLKTVSRDASDNINSIRIDLATLAERVSHLPGRTYIGAFITGGVAFAIAALTLLSKLGWLVAGAPK